MSRRSRARERADVEKAASAPAKKLPREEMVMAPPLRDPLDAFMAEIPRRLRFQWEAWRDPSHQMIVAFRGRAAGPFEPLFVQVYVPAREIESAPNHVLERLQHAERQMVEAVEYQQLVYDAMQEMRDAGRAEAEAKGAVWRPADLAVRQDADYPCWMLHQFHHQLANLVFSSTPPQERWFGPAPRRGVHP